MVEQRGRVLGTRALQGEATVDSRRSPVVAGLLALALGGMAVPLLRGWDMQPFTSTAHANAAVVVR